MIYQIPYIPNREKYNKQHKMCQVTLPQSDISLFPNAVAMATATWHTDIPLKAAQTS
jgi:hypothetical protein